MDVAFFKKLRPKKGWARVGKTKRVSKMRQPAASNILRGLIMQDNKTDRAFEVFSKEVQKKFDTSDYALKVMWRPLPYKNRLPYI